MRELPTHSDDNGVFRPLAPPPFFFFLPFFRRPDAAMDHLATPTDHMDLDLGKRPRTLSSIQAIASAGEADGRASTHSEVGEWGSCAR